MMQSRGGKTQASQAETWSTAEALGQGRTLGMLVTIPVPWLSL